MPGWFDGVKFRSHTEARWAMFWKELGIPWVYEPQGYKTDEQPYLPDFVIFPALGKIWVEIKASWDADPGGVAKWRKFAGQRPQPSRACLIPGVPSIHCAPLVIGGDDDSDNPLKGGWEADTFEWRPCPGGHHFDLAWPGKFGAKFAEDGCPDDFGGSGEQRIADACATALGYRFGKQVPPSGTAA
jgi:hypothetical protein